MDTNNFEFQQALEELYAAVLKLMRLCGKDILTDDMKCKELTARMTALMAEYTQYTSDIQNCQSEKPASMNLSDNPIQPQQVQPVTSSNKVFVGNRFAVKAEEDGGEYLFRRTRDRIEDSDTDRYFILHIYSDNTGEFEMTDDIVGEKLQSLSDNKDFLLVNDVVKYSGSITATCRIVTKDKGQIIKKGKSWLITKPLEIEFK